MDREKSLVVGYSSLSCLQPRVEGLSQIVSRIDFGLPKRVRPHFSVHAYIA